MTYEGLRLRLSGYWRRGFANRRGYWEKTLLLYRITAGEE